MVTLREVFEELAGAGHPDPAAVLRGHGFDLPEEDLRQALISYAQSAPVEVAAHLQPYVMTSGPVPGEGPDGVATPADGLGLLTAAPLPQAEPEDPAVDLDDLSGVGPATVGALPALAAEGVDPLDFGGGAEGPPGPAPQAPESWTAALEAEPDPGGVPVDGGAAPASADDDPTGGVDALGDPDRLDDTTGLDDSEGFGGGDPADGVNGLGAGS